MTPRLLAQLGHFIDGLLRRNPGEAEFHQTVYEVATDIIPFIQEKLEYQEA